jgi:hypothetical protein
LDAIYPILPLKNVWQNGKTASPVSTLFTWLISHQPVVLFSHNKPATSNQLVVLFSQNKSAPAISHQPNHRPIASSSTVHDVAPASSAGALPQRRPHGQHRWPPLFGPAAPRSAESSGATHSWLHLTSGRRPRLHRQLHGQSRPAAPRLARLRVEGSPF